MTSPTRGGLAPGPSPDPGLDSEPGRGVRQSILRLRFTAIAAGAPTATPVADRLHLVHNLRNVLERVFRWHGVGPAPVPPLGEPDPPRGPAASAPLPVGFIGVGCLSRKASRRFTPYLVIPELRSACTLVHLFRTGLRVRCPKP